MNKAICLAELSKKESNLQRRKLYLVEAQQLLEDASREQSLTKEVEPILQKVEALAEHCKQEGH